MAWSLPCHLCFSKSYRANEKRKLARRPFSDTAGVLGPMYADRDSAVAAHNECLWYAAGQDLIQYEDEDLEGEENLNRFKISAIQKCINEHKPRKCYFCNMKGACCECASPRCRGKKGWYHLPCGLRNGTVQLNGKTFCGEKHALKERRSLEVAADRKKIPILFTKEDKLGRFRRNEMKRKVTPKKASSFKEMEGSDLELGERVAFLFIKVRKLIPFGSNVDDPRVYIDVAEMEDQETMEDTVTDQSGGALSLNYNATAGSIDANTSPLIGFPLMDIEASAEKVDLEDDLQLSQTRSNSPMSGSVTRPNSPMSSGFQDDLQLSQTRPNSPMSGPAGGVQDEVIRSHDSIGVEVNAVNTSLDTLISELGKTA